MNVSIAVLLAVAIVVVVSAQTGTRPKPTNTQKTQFDKAKKGLKKVNSRQAGNQLRGQLGSLIGGLKNDELDKVIEDAEKVITGSNEYMDTKSIASRVRKDTGFDTSKLSDEALDNLIDRLEKIGDDQDDAITAEQAAMDAEKAALEAYQKSLQG